MKVRKYALAAAMILVAFFAKAQNPLFKDADPTARVFNGKIFVYTTSESGNNHWNIYSSSDLKKWEHHGQVTHLKDIPWRNMDPDKQWGCWAPDCIERDGKYYFYGPVLNTNEELYPRNSPIVMVADHPEGPYRAPLNGPIIYKYHDPNVFINTDGQAYLYSRDKVALLGDDMISVKETKNVTLDFTPSEKWEATFVFERKGMYYFTFADNFNHLKYATGSGPLGPFTLKGEIMAAQKGNNHHSFVFYEGRWILFYHLRNNGVERIKDRMVWADYIDFEDDGSIKPVVPTTEGIQYTGKLNATLASSQVKKLEYQFTCTVSGGHQGKNINKTIQWDFGDGNYSEENNPMHSYRKKGSYHVLVKIRDGEMEEVKSLSINVK